MCWCICNRTFPMRDLYSPGAVKWIGVEVRKSRRQNCPRLAIDIASTKGYREKVKRRTWWRNFRLHWAKDKDLDKFWKNMIWCIKPAQQWHSNDRATMLTQFQYIWSLLYSAHLILISMIWYMFILVMLYLISFGTFWTVVIFDSSWCIKLQ